MALQLDARRGPLPGDCLPPRPHVSRGLPQQPAGRPRVHLPESPGEETRAHVLSKSERDSQYRECAESMTASWRARIRSSAHLVFLASKVVFLVDRSEVQLSRQVAALPLAVRRLSYCSCEELVQTCTLCEVFPEKRTQVQVARFFLG